MQQDLMPQSLSYLMLTILVLSLLTIVFGSFYIIIKGFIKSDETMQTENLNNKNDYIPSGLASVMVGGIFFGIIIGLYTALGPFQNNETFQEIMSLASNDSDPVLGSILFFSCISGLVISLLQFFFTNMKKRKHNRSEETGP